MKKIAILELYSGPSGTPGFYNSQEIGLAKAFEKMGHFIYIIYPRKHARKRESREISGHIVILYVPAVTLGNHSFFGLKFLTELGIDVVHLDADNQAYAPHVMEFCRRNHIRFYNYVGTVYSDSRNPVKRALLLLFSYRNIRCFKKYRTVAKTEQIREVLVRHGVSDVEVLPVGLDLDIIPEVLGSREQLCQELSLPADKKILLFVGRLDEYKRPLDAVELLELLGESYHLVIIGQGSLEQKIYSAVSKKKLKKRVRHIRQVPNTQIHSYYKAADCLINFNKKEIFGMSILEAMYQGCPVVARHAPGPDTTIVDEKTGYVCDSLDEMADRVRQVDASMGQAGTERIRKGFTWEKTAKGLLDGM